MAVAAPAPEIVRYEPGLRERVVELQRHLWRGDAARNRRYLAWKYERNPYFAEPLMYVAMSGGRAVGMRGMIGSCWEAGPAAERFLVPCAEDFVIAPEERTHGLFARIMRVAMDDLAARGHACAFSLSAGAVTLAGSLAGGWSGVAPMRPAVLEEPGSPVLEKLRERLSRTPGLWRLAEAGPLAHGSLGRRSFARLARGARARPSSGIVVSEAPPVAGMADLVRRLGHDGRLRHVRDEAYLSWRFDNPLQEYRFLSRGEAGRLEGFLVLQRSRLDASRGVHIVDWESETLDVRARLFRAALAWGRFPRVSVWTTGLPDATRAIVAEAGLVVQEPVGLSRPGPWVLVRAIGPGRRTADLSLSDRRLLDPSHWDMRMIYSMSG